MKDRGDLKERIREASDIVDVVARYVPLKRSGSGFKGLCPFHEEKTPSFTVNPRLQWFTCFGCGQKGDVFTFIQKMEKVEFPEAIEILAERAGIDVSQYRGADPEESRRRKEGKSVLYRLNEAAATFYEHVLHSPRGQRAADYLSKRGITEELAKEFRLGYAPDGWDELSSHMAARKASEKLVLASGLVRQRDGGGVYDLFRDRLMFPITDAQGRIVGFGGRVLPGAPDDAPKYVNSPETPLFRKSALLYGLARAQEGMKLTGEAILVEGYTDVIACHKAGIANAVAALGTALTSEHVRILRRYAERAVMVFDPDEAGVRAARRALAVAVAEGYEVRAARLPGEGDPADLIESGGAESFRETVKNATEALEFTMACASEGRDLSDDRRKASVIGEVMEFVASEPSPVVRSLMRERVARRFGVPEESLELPRGASRRAERSAPRAEGAPALPRRRCSEQAVVRNLLLTPSMMGEVEKIMDEEGFTDPAAREVYEALVAGVTSPKDLVGRLDSEEAKGLVIAAVERPAGRKRSAEDELPAALAQLQGVILEDRLTRIDAQLAAAEGSGGTGTGEYAELLRERMKTRERMGELSGTYVSRRDRTRSGGAAGATDQIRKGLQT